MLEDAKAIANEWVTRERLGHVLDKLQVEAANCGDSLELHHLGIEQTGEVIKKMIDDVLREAEGEILDSPDARKQIGRLTALMFKDYLHNQLCA